MGYSAVYPIDANYLCNKKSRAEFICPVLFILIRTTLLLRQDFFQLGKAGEGVLLG